MEILKLFVDGKEVVSYGVQMPDIPTVASQWEYQPSFSGSLSFTYKLASGKKGRRIKRQLEDLIFSDRGLPFIRHYRRVKHHQKRKRLLAKGR